MAQAKDDAHDRSAEALEHAREKAHEAGEALHRAGSNAARPWKSMRDEIRADMDAADAAIIEAIAVAESDLEAERTNAYGMRSNGEY